MMSLKQNVLESLGLTDPWESEYRHLELNPQGWFIGEAQKLMDAFCLQRRPRIIIELGSWLGKSTRFFAERCELVIAVDHWLGSVEHQKSKHETILPVLFDQFLSNCEPLRDKIIPIRMTTDTAAKLPLPRADMIYVDAAHDQASVAADIEHYHGFLSEHGLMCGDDYATWTKRGMGIAKVVHAFAAGHNLEVGVQMPVWWYVPMHPGNPAYVAAKRS